MQTQAFYSTSGPRTTTERPTLQFIREIADVIFGLLCWALFIFGPFALLLAGMPRLAIAASAVSLAAFVLSFRWRSGYVLILSYLGTMLLLNNTLTLCIASASIAKSAGFSTMTQFLVGISGIPVVVALIYGVERGANFILGPVVNAESTHDDYKSSSE